MKARTLAAALSLGAVASLGLATAALGHPLGNYTVNRAVSVTLSRDGIGVRYVVDMAEIPAFGTLQLIDTDADGATQPLEERAWADATCEASRAALAVAVDGRRLAVASAGDPALTFPAGAGGLDTLRLECPLEAEWTPVAGEHAIVVLDRTDDGHIGWREVTIAADGWALLSSSVPAVSPSGQLTAYPTDSLAAPPDIRSGMAAFRVANGPAAHATAGATPSGPRSTSEDPLAGLIAGDLTLPVALVALLIAGGLGAAHALSPGHGKTLVAAYLLGSGGTLRQAAGLGITVAITHTLGVFALGAATLAAGELFVPERVVPWLSVASGALVALLGIGLVWRGLRAAHGRARHNHAQRPAHEHPHPHAHPRERAKRPSSLRLRSILALGLAGGMVPSASALIVLLAAVSTGRLLFGIGLIVAFGVGMAVVLAGLAAATTVARRAIVAPRGIAWWPLARTVTALLPVASGIVVLIIGSVVTLAALGRIG